MCKQPRKIRLCRFLKRLRRPHRLFCILAFCGAKHARRAKKQPCERQLRKAEAAACKRRSKRIERRRVRLLHKRLQPFKGARQTAFPGG